MTSVTGSTNNYNDAFSRANTNPHAARDNEKEVAGRQSDALYECLEEDARIPSAR